MTKEKQRMAANRQISSHAATLEDFGTMFGSRRKQRLAFNIRVLRAVFNYVLQ
jgi:hypothetical protein